MIVRAWQARSTRDGAAQYERHFRTEVAPELRSVAGFRGAQLLGRDAGEGIELVVLTRWESLDAVHGFAGTDVNRAVVRPGATVVLTDWDDEVRHFTILDEVFPG
jgi:heme-degrading monooxygenase HmoA